MEEISDVFCFLCVAVEEIDEILSVTRDDIIAAANKISLDTVYLLTSKEGGDSNEA